MNRIHKKILYPLPATTITDVQLQEISDLLYSTSLPKCGIIRSFPIRFRTLPTYYFGLGMPDLYLEMQINKVKEFIQHCMTELVLGKQLQFQLETMQLQAGVGDFILNYDYNKFSNLVFSGWIAHMWKFTSDMKYTFSGWNNVLKPQRDNDKYIMEEFVRFGYTKQKLQLLNKCRIYLQAISLSDIANGQGNQIVKNYLEGRRDAARRSTFAWPNTKRPGYNDWYTWSSAIKEVFCSNDTGAILKQSLGVWKHTQYCDWDWYYDPAHDLLYNKQVRHVIKYSPTRERRSSERIGCKWYKAREILKSHVPIHEYERANIAKETKGVKLVSFQGSAKCECNDAQQNPPLLTLLQITEASEIQLPPIHEHNFMSITIPEVQHLLSKSFKIVADGSYKENDSSYCTILESSDQKVQIVFTGKCVQNIGKYTKNTDPYRIEMMGLYVGLLLTYIMEQYSPNQATAVLSSDNDAALDAVGTFSYTKVGQQHFDIIKASISLRKSLKTKIHTERVMGHADAKSPKQPPTRTELLNQSCDFMAKVTREYAKPIGPLPIPFEGLSIWKKNFKIYNNFVETIRWDYYMKKATPTICDKFQWTTQQMQSVDWRAKYRSTKLLSSYSNLWISKYATGFLPIAVNMERRNEWQQNYCSRCGTAIETKDHIAKCTEITSTNLFAENLQVFEKWMEKMETPTQLKIHILTRITSWRMNVPWTLGSDFAMPSPVSSQLQLGPWTHFMEGRLHIGWCDYMQRHYHSIKSKRMGEQWTAQCIQRIWKLFHIDQWHIRNKFVHNKTEATKSTRKRENLQHAVQKAYVSVEKETLLVKDQSLYDSPLSTIQSYSDDAMISWLKDHSLAIRDRDDTFHSSSTPNRHFANVAPAKTKMLLEHI